jgi:hypothetical protein
MVVHATQQHVQETGSAHTHEQRRRRLQPAGCERRLFQGLESAACLRQLPGKLSCYIPEQATPACPCSSARVP